MDEHKPYCPMAVFIYKPDIQIFALRMTNIINLPRWNSDVTWQINRSVFLRWLK